MSGRPIVIGSRGSALALAQAKLVDEALKAEGHASRIEVIETDGDRRAPDTAWGEGAFVAAIERALLDGLVDVAVHSAKDIPTDEDPRLRIAAYLPRADPRDALVVRTDATERRLADLPSGSRIGTDSPRRTAFLLARRPDIVVSPLHGNVDTRLRRLDAGETDALVLACAGLDRMGLGARIAERLEPEVVPPAPGQGAIAVQVRGDDEAMSELVATIDDTATRAAVEAERAFLRASGGGCRSPIGALATMVGDELDLLGGHASPDGVRIAIARRRAPVGSGADLGHRLAVELDPHGAVPGTAADRTGDRPRADSRTVLVTRPAEQADELAAALRDVGLRPVSVPAITVEIDPRGALDTAAKLLHTYRWAVVTSANGARAMVQAAAGTPEARGRPACAAIGPATSRILEREGIEVGFQPSRRTSAAMGAELPLAPGDRVLVIRGDLGGEDLALALRARGADVDDVVGYRTREAPDSSRDLLRRAVSDGPIAAAVFTSGSTVRGLAALGEAESIDVRSFPAVCIGPGTADEARQAGFQVLATSTTSDSAALAAATAIALARQPEETP